MSLILAAFIAIPAPSQVVSEMTPERIREAIALGSQAKQYPSYEIRKPGGFGSLYKPVLGAFSTPFLRVAQAAYTAKKLYKPFAEGDVTPEMIAPVLQVSGLAQAEGARVANVVSIVVTPNGKRDPADAIRPQSSGELPVQFRNLLGMTAEGKSLLTTFPLSVLDEANEVHIIFDSGVHPRWTPQIRPPVDTSKPATTGASGTCSFWG